MAKQVAHSLWDFFAERGRSFSNNLALHTESASLTFGELLSLSDSLARSLADHGVRDSDVVALALPNTLSFAPCVLALAQLNVTIALLSTKYGPNELDAIGRGIRPDFLLSGAAFACDPGAHLGAGTSELVRALPG